MEFKHLEVFVKLVENLSFSAAAEELNISQPTVSLHIKQLEEELDTPLFIRSTRELKITEEGTILYREAKDLLQQRSTLIDRFINPKDIADRLIYHSNRLYSPLCIEPVQKDAPQYSYSS